MKIFPVLLLVAAVLAGCSATERFDNKTYLALVAKTHREYFQSPERAYQAEMRFAQYVRDSMHRGIDFPNETVLVWTYPRIALSAEYAGRKNQADNLFAFAEEFRKRVYPNQPIDGTGRFHTLREAVIYMDRESGVPWLK